MAKTQAVPKASVSRVVAYNLKRARTLRGLTQEEAAALLHKELGGGWKMRTTLSNAEAYNGDRVRRFDPDEIFVFSVVFDLPISWFFVPPPPGEIDIHVDGLVKLLDRATYLGEYVGNRVLELDRNERGHEMVSAVMVFQNMRRQEWREREAAERARAEREKRLRDHFGESDDRPGGGKQ
jgi:transcriptional regulator with XRE-family HTH domain